MADKTGRLSRLFGTQVSRAGPQLTQPAPSGAVEVANHTVAAPRHADVDGPPAAVAAVSGVWNVHDVILDLYEVRPIKEGHEPHYAEGGFGRVYRVHHKGWDLDLAAKVPREDKFKTEAEIENVTRECQTWVNLGLHPNVVSCHYVRRLGSVPVVFAEFVEGGRLTDWIENRRLYEGGPEESLKRILDVAIQFAWGLGHAHENGLVHQDVKPDNVMMTLDGTAKVTDFGLAKARAVVGNDPAAAGGRQNILVSSGGMTPAYCSPEQANHQPLSRKTDIWSWGLSVLQMFTGGVFWLAGQAGPEALASYLENGPEEASIPKMPNGVVALLTRCFHRHPQHRPKDMVELAGELVQLYRECTGANYARTEPKATDLLADGLSNKAISLLDLGRTEDAHGAFIKALHVDPQHAETRYNRGMVLWRSARITDEELIRSLGDITHTCDCRSRWLLGMVHMERGDAESAALVLEDIAPRCGEDRQVLALLTGIRAGAVRGARCVRVLQGHTDEVLSVALSTDSRLGLSASRDRTLRLWDLATGKCVRTLEGHQGRVTSALLCPDGRFCLSASSDGTLRLWELATGKCVRTLSGHAAWSNVESVSVTPDGQLAFSAGEDNALRLWSLATGECLRAFEGHTRPVLAAAICPFGHWGLSGSADNSVRLWDLATGRCLRTFQGHVGPVFGVAISSDERFVLSCGRDEAIRIWDTHTGKCRTELRGHDGCVRCVTICRDGRWVLSGEQDKALRLWDAATGRCLRTFRDHGGAVNAVAFNADGSVGLSGSSDCTLRLWDVTTGAAQALAVARPSDTARLTALAATVQRLRQRAVECLDGGDIRMAIEHVGKAVHTPGYERDPALMHLWNAIGLRSRRTRLHTHSVAMDLKGHQGAVTSVAFTPDSLFGLSGSTDKTLRLWDLSTGQCLRALEGHNGEVTSVATSAAGQWGLSGSYDHTLRLWELATGRCLRTFKGHEAWVASVAISRDGQWGLSGSYDNTVRLWHLQTGKSPRTLEGHEGWVLCVAISPDGRFGLSGSSDNTLRVWDLSTGKCLRVLAGHHDAVRAIAVSPDGRAGLSGSSDGTVRWWELATGNCLRSFDHSAHAVSAVVVSPDCHFGLSASEHGEVRLWTLDTGEGVPLSVGCHCGMTSLAVSPDSRYLLCGGGRDDRIARLGELRWEYVFPGWSDWDEGARPWLECCLTLHAHCRTVLTPWARKPTLTREVSQRLLEELALAGYGWLRPEGVHKELESMTRSWARPLPMLT
jgi:WD40 repeat protein